MLDIPAIYALPEFKFYAIFDPDDASLEKLMLKGEEKETWKSICEKVGQFLATARESFIKVDVDQVLQYAVIRNRSVLGEWIEKVNNSWDIIATMPEVQRRNLNMEILRERSKQAAAMMQNAKFLNLDNIVTKNVQLLPGQQNVQINFNEIELVYGPLGLQTSIFLADLLVKYHQQLRLEHSIRYITSDCAKSFGQAYNSKLNSDKADDKTFWEQTSLLTGWEIIRRATDDETLRELDRQNEVTLSDVFDVGFRLIFNERIDNINFMINVALAELL